MAGIKNQEFIFYLIFNYLALLAERNACYAKAVLPQPYFLYKVKVLLKGYDFFPDNFGMRYTSLNARHVGWYVKKY